jgi:CBS domain-containing protein
MKVRELMSYPIATVRPEDTVLTAVKRMAGEKKGSVLVARDGLLKECLGILTTSRIFLRVFAEGRDPGAVAVQEIMTAGPLISIDLDATTAEAARLMREHNIRRLPVMKEGALVGIITSKDLLACVR